MKSNYLQHLGLNEPWAINLEYAQNYFPVLAKILMGNALDIDSDTSEQRQANRSYCISANAKGDYSTQTTISDAGAGAVAVLNLKGPVMKYSQMCGPQGTVDIAADLKAIEQNPNIIGTVMIVESGGGQSYAMKPLTDQMDASTKPIVVLGGNVIASAAYGISVHANEIIVDHPRAVIGSIGTMVSLQNVQPALEKMGVQFHEIYATKSTLKNQSYIQALEGNYDKIRSEIDLLNEDFIADIKSSRPGISSTDKTIFAGEIYSALQAVELGMIDAIGNLDMAISRVKALSSNPENKNKNNPNSNTMEFKKIQELAGVKTPTSDQLAMANAELTLAGITSATIVSEEVINEAATVTAANADLTAQVTALTTSLETANASLATAQQELATANTTVTDLQAKVDAFGANAGANHKGEAGNDDATDGDDVERILAALPHNKKADSFL